MRLFKSITAAALLFIYSAAAAHAQVDPFKPSGYTVTPLSTTTTSAAATMPAGTQSVLVQNVGADAVFCQPGASTTTSAVYISPSGGSYLFPMGGGTQISCKDQTSTSTVNFTPGSGYAIVATGGGGGSTTIANPLPISGAVTVTSGAITVSGTATVSGTVTAANSGSLTNPTSNQTLASSVTAYTAGQLMANSGTAGSVVVPSFAIANSAGGAYINRLRIYINDGVSTGFGAMTIQVDLWTTAPTFANGDHAAFAPATNINAHLGAFTCATSAVFGTTGLNTAGNLGNGGVYAECYPVVGSYADVKLASGTSIFWTSEAITGSGVITTGGATEYLVAELTN